MKTSISNRFLSALRPAALPALMTAAIAVTLSGQHAAATALTWDITSGDGATITDGSGAWATGAGNWNNGFGDDSWIDGDSATFNGATGGTITVDAAGVSQTGITFDGANNYTVSGGAISGTGGLLKIGGGTVSLSGTGNAVSSLTVNGGTLAVTGGDVTSSGDLRLSNSGTADTGLSVSGGTLTVNDSIISGNTNAQSTITQTGGAIFLSTGSGYFSLANVGGTTTMALSGGTFSCADYWGAVLAQRGTSIVTISGTAVATFAPAINGAIGLTLAGQSTGNCTLNLDGGTLVVGSILKGDGTGSMNFNGGTLKASRSITSFVTGLTTATVKSGGAVIDSNSFDVGIAQALVHDPALGATVDGGLTKKGADTLTLSGTNTYTGGTTIHTGTLATANFASLGSGMIDIKAAGTYAFSTNGSNQPTFANAVSGAGAFTVTGSGGNQSFWSGGFSGFSGTLTINAGANLWAVSSTNTGSTSMKVNLSGGLGLYGNESNIAITRTYHIGELTGSAGSLIFGTPSTNNVITLSVGALNTSSTFAGIIRNDWQGTTTSTVGLTKDGTGTLTLSGANTYTGATTITAGTLALDAAGSIATSSSVAIAAGAKLETVLQTTYTIPAGKTVTFGLNAAGAGSSGQINAAGLDISTATVAFDISGTLDDAAYVLATYGVGTLAGSAFASVPTVPGYTIDYAYNSGTQIALVQSAATGYGSWASANADNQAANLDFDNDGVDNGVEFFMGQTGSGFTGSPTSFTAHTATWTNGGNIAADQYGTQFVIQTSTDLVNWTPILAENPNLNNQAGSVSFTLTGSGSQFARLTVTPN